MRKVLSSLIIFSALVLSACGGDSDSSSDTSNNGFVGYKTLVSGNRYMCSTREAYSLCEDDKTCAASCKLIATDANPANPIDPSVTNPCDTEGVNVYGKKGSACLIPISSINNSEGKRYNLVCSSTGGASIGNSIKAGGSINLNGYNFSCR